MLQSNGHIVLTDFDLSKRSVTSTPKVANSNHSLRNSFQLIKSMFAETKIATEPGIMSNSLVGTDEYLAPEVITGIGHTSSVDWFVALYVFLLIV